MLIPVSFYPCTHSPKSGKTISSSSLLTSLRIFLTINFWNFFCFYVYKQICKRPLVFFHACKRITMELMVSSSPLITIIEVPWTCYFFCPCTFSAARHRKTSRLLKRSQDLLCIAVPQAKSFTRHWKGMHLAAYVLFTSGHPTLWD